MEASRRLLNLTYALGALLAYVLFSKLYATVFASVGLRDAQLLGKAFTTSTLLAAVTALTLLFWLWRHARFRPLVQESADELTHVTWPTWEETKSNTRVVIVVSIVAAIILWVFDQVFGALTNLLLGGPVT